MAPSGKEPFLKPYHELAEGDTFATAGRTVTESDVVAFATMTGDTHPQHTDADWASKSRFGERVAHGMLVLTYAVGLIPFEAERVVALRRVEEAVFKRPVKLGETIHVEGRIDRAEPLEDDLGLVTCALKILNSDDDKVVGRARVQVLWRGAETASAEADEEGAAESADGVPPGGREGVVPL